MIALTFAAPVLLIGLVAAGIPPLLHLISSVRAREQYFPTLRFLRVTMEKTARRRRLQNWLLLLLRSLALAVLALAVAQPLSEATGGWLGGQGQAAIVVLDDSYSMTATPEPGGETLFGHVRGDASALLSGEDKPALASLAAASGTGPAQLTGQLDLLRQDLARASVQYGPPALTENIASAVETLVASDAANRSLYILTDGQAVAIDAEGLRSRLAGLDVDGLHTFVIQRSLPQPDNVGVTEARIGGAAIVDAPAEIHATIVNASPTARRVEVELRVDGQDNSEQAVRHLAPAGTDGDRAAVVFRHRFRSAGGAVGEIRIVSDDALPADNVRYLAANVARQATALIVAPPRPLDRHRAFDPQAMLQIALDWRDPLAAQEPWPIRTRTALPSEISEATLKDVDAVFLADVPGFSAEAARAIRKFVEAGGSAMFFLGPDVDAENYNERFAGDGGLLPGELGPAVGQIGLEADALGVGRMDIEHPLLAGLFDRRADYPDVLVQRYVELKRPATSGRVLMTLENGRDLVVAQPYGEGRAVWCMTTASPRWTNLPTTGAGVFVPVVVRLTLAAAAGGRSDAYTAGAAVSINARPASPTAALPEFVEVMLPTRGNAAETVRVEVGDDGVAQFTATERPGVYSWSATTPEREKLGGVFAVNPWGAESQLATLSPADLRETLEAAGLDDVYVGPSLQAVHAAARERAIGRNWWDLLAGAAILLLLGEALVANRRKAQDLLPPAGPAQP